MSGDLACYSLDLFHIQDAVRLWDRIIKMSNDRISMNLSDIENMKCLYEEIYMKI